MRFSTAILAGLVGLLQVSASPINVNVARQDPSSSEPTPTFPFPSGSGFPTGSFSLPSGFPTGSFSLPSGFPTGSFSLPSGFPTGSFSFPSGFPTGSFSFPSGSFSLPPFPSGTADSGNADFEFGPPASEPGKFSFSTGTPRASESRSSFRFPSGASFPFPSGSGSRPGEIPTSRGYPFSFPSGGRPSGSFPTGRPTETPSRTGRLDPPTALSSVSTLV
ncbi:hypothetical protein GSI_03486 [Ganoderma sinense ZZ0214-1]|uniref:Transporter n=1 Tax=Ganoderma sinense ZZ0214-1 TaxID=1077348 RepID=A0A2G8SLQ6_9APHY|nr:hypothetical protein GSI_03486 [Ganoderma sinense ZZ0214-1]